MIINKFSHKFGQFYSNLKNTIKEIYQSSNFYDKKISKTKDITLEYKPSPYLLFSIVKYQKKKYRIEDFALKEVWQENIKNDDFEKLNNFFWFFSLEDRKSVV